MGGLKTTAAGDMRKQHPERIVEEAVRGMLPKTKLGRAMFGKLKVYAGDGPSAPGAEACEHERSSEERPLSTATEYYATGKRKTSIARVRLAARHR